MNRNRKNSWSACEKQKMIELYPEANWGDLLKAFPNRTANSIKVFANKNGIYRLKNNGMQSVSNRPYYNDFVKDLPYLSMYELHKKYGVSESSVLKFRKQLNIKVLHKKNYLFEVGNRPWNKGKQLSDSHREKIRATFFKNGHKPHNTLEDGCVVLRSDNYKYIRVSSGKWELYHRYMWEQANGAIPKGYIIIFRDGDSTNCVLENLMLISKTENMYRNSRHDFAKEIIPSMLLLKNLVKQLKKRNNGK